MVNRSRFNDFEYSFRRWFYAKSRFIDQTLAKPIRISTGNLVKIRRILEAAWQGYTQPSRITASNVEVIRLTLILLYGQGFQRRPSPTRPGPHRPWCDCLQRSKFKPQLLRH